MVVVTGSRFNARGIKQTRGLLNTSDMVLCTYKPKGYSIFMKIDTFQFEIINREK